MKIPMKKKVFTSAQDRKLKKLFDDGVSILGIAKNLKVSRSVVVRRIAELQLSRPDASEAWMTNPIVIRLLEIQPALHGELTRVAEEFGVSRQRVQQLSDKLKAYEQSK